MSSYTKYNISSRKDQHNIGRNAAAVGLEQRASQQNQHAQSTA